jgi:predicted transcriptional regulator of viral defense system
MDSTLTGVGPDMDNMLGYCVYYPSILSTHMASPSASLVDARNLFQRHHGMLRTSEALRLGIHPRTLYALRDSGELVSVGRGLYRLASAPALAHPDWVAVALRVPRAVICLVSALAHYELTTQVPHHIDIALPSHSQVPRVDGLPMRVFWYPERAFRAGIDMITLDQVRVRIYSPEKTIVDCFKYRNKTGIDIAVEALRNYRQKVPKLPVKKLLEYARICRVEKVMRPYLEAVL